MNVRLLPGFLALGIVACTTPDDVSPASGPLTDVAPLVMLEPGAPFASDSAILALEYSPEAGVDRLRVAFGAPEETWSDWKALRRTIQQDTEPGNSTDCVQPPASRPSVHNG